jgi:hypothetical protein
MARLERGEKSFHKKRVAQGIAVVVAISMNAGMGRFSGCRLIYLGPLSTLAFCRRPGALLVLLSIFMELFNRRHHPDVGQMAPDRRPSV